MVPQARTRDPGDSVAGAEGENAWEQTVFGHRVGKTREGEREGVEGAEAVERTGEDDGHGEHRAAEEAGGVCPGTGREACGGDADGPDGEQRKRVDAHDGERGDEHGARIVALRVFDLLRDGGGVVPAHVVPHGDGECAAEIVGEGLAAGGEMQAAVGDAPERDDEHDGEGRERDGHHARRSRGRRRRRRGGSRAWR